MENKKFLAQFSNKQVTFRFMRQELRLALSHSLFSSFDIDAGSRLLLKSIAKELDLQEIHDVLDLGCGVGTLGLALAKAAPHVRLLAQDRNALAAAFTRLNANQNKLKNVSVQGGLAFQDVSGPFDLIVANLPGKASEPVLRHMLSETAVHLSANGRAAVVIVTPLAPFVSRTLQEQAHSLLFTEEGKGHTVFHFRGGSAPTPPPELLQPYTRGLFPFSLGGHNLTLRTVYNLPEFDTLGHHTALAVNVLKDQPVSGHVLIWNPGQGHLPLYLFRKMGAGISQLTLAGRDALSLQNSLANLLAYGANAAHTSLLHLPHVLELPNSYDWIITFPDVDPGVPWEKYLLPALADRLSAGGRLLLTGKSAFVFRLLAAPHPFHRLLDRKKQGYRSLLLHGS